MQATLADLVTLLLVPLAFAAWALLGVHIALAVVRMVLRELTA